MKNLYLFTLLTLFLKASLFVGAQSDCENAHVIPSLPFSATELTTEGMDSNYGPEDACESDAMEGEEYVFEYTPSEDVQIAIRLLNNDLVGDMQDILFVDVGIFVIHGCPDDDDAVCVGFTTSQTPNPSINYVELEANETYYIVISTSTNMAGQDVPLIFDIEIEENPTGAPSDCNNAHLVSSLPFNATELTTVNAGNNYDESDACGSEAMENEEYVFEFTADEDMQINVFLHNTEIIAEAMGDFGMGDIGLFITELCPDDNDAVCIAKIDTIGANPSLTDIDLEAGKTYYIIVSSANADLFGLPMDFPTNVNFDIEITKNLANDVGVYAIVSPKSKCSLSTEEEVTIEIRNYGIEAQSNIPVNFYVEDVSTWLETPEVYSGTIEPGETSTYTFTATVDLSDISMYEIFARTELDGDENDENDEASVLIANTPVYSSFPTTEDFEDGEAYWTVSGDNPSWELGEPVDTAGIEGAVSGNYAWVTNLEGTANMQENSYLTTPCYDFTDLQAPTVEFYIWRTFGIFGNSGHLIGSTDGGENWNDTIITWTGASEDWELMTHTIHDYAGEANVRFRFNYNGGFLVGAGMGIDDFTVREGTLADVGVIEITEPISGCGLTDSENVTIKIVNFGYVAQSDIPVNLSIDGGSNWLSSPETYTGTIEPGDTATYTFTATVDLTGIGEYEIQARTELSEDEDADNDMATIHVNSLETITSFDYEESFESGPAGWFAYGTNSSLELAQPNAVVINQAGDGDYAWVTNPDGFANPNEHSYLQSPCFDFSDLDNPIFEVMIQYETNMMASFTLEYSLDGGHVWDTVKAEDAAINWYGAGFGGLMSGWSGNSEGWITASTTMENLANEPQVSFRFNFSRGLLGTGENEGVAIDLIKIFDCDDDLPIADFDFSVEGQTVTFTNNSQNATSYHWDFGSGLILPDTSTEENPVHEYTTSGVYDVTLTASNACGSDVITKEVIVGDVNVEEMNTAVISVFPNPASSNVFISNDDRQNVTVNVMSVNGQIILSKKSYDSLIELNVADIAQGAYFIQVIRNNEIKVFPIIIE